MADDASALLLDFRMPAPQAIYPLMGSVYTVGVKKVDPTQSTVRMTAFTYNWRGGPGGSFMHNEYTEQNLFPRTVRNAAVRKWDAPIGQTGVHAVMTRQWNGIGGFIYIPSFPQLERKETTWPHAT